MNINFRKITADNWEECVNLTVNEEQKNFVAPNAFSLAQAAYDAINTDFDDDDYETIRTDETDTVRAIYVDDTMVGFIMYCVDSAERKAWISRYMIDKNYQGNGYGKAALAKILDFFENKLNCIETGLSEVPENFLAKKVYGSLGFEFTGEVEDDEEIMVKKATVIA